MVLARQQVVRDVIARVEEGLGMRWSAKHSLGVEESLCKFWVIMEMKSLSFRAAFLADDTIWTDTDIRNFQRFLVKLDMRLSDPVLGDGYCALSHLLLTQRSLRPLLHALTFPSKLDTDTLTKFIVQTYPTLDVDTDTFPWLDDELDTGIPQLLWGIQYKDNWSHTGERMESCVDMVIAEGVRRELNVQRDLLEFVVEGYGRGAMVNKRWRKGMREMGRPVGRGLGERLMHKMDVRYGLREVWGGDGMERDGGEGGGDESETGSEDGSGEEEDSEEDEDMDESG